jgi:hypothetical protein
VYSPAGSVPPPSHLNSCTPTKSNLYFDSSFDTVTSEPALYKLLTFYVLSLIVLIPSLRLFIQGISPSSRLIFMFHNRFIFYGEVLLAPRQTPNLEDHPLSSVRVCLFNVFASNLHSWRPSLYPRPEDVPCCGDRDPPNMDD